MFGSSKYIQNSFSLSFRRYPEIRRRSNEFEDLLNKHFKDHYGQPQVIPVPDELDPEVPRLIFGSKHGFSQILISQNSVILNVTYSPDWQADIQKGVQYLKERSSVLYLLLSIIEELQVYFCGLTTRIQIPSKCDEIELFKLFKNNFVKLNDKNIFYDTNIKITTVIEDKFFNNISIQNYRIWKLEKSFQDIPRFSKNLVNEKGIEIICDFNDRYSYNEKNNYFSSREVKESIIDKGIEQVKRIIDKVKEE